MNTQPSTTPEIVNLTYEGEQWTAKRLRDMSFVLFSPESCHRSGMIFAVPDQNISNLAKRIYKDDYTPTRDELLTMLSVIDSYRALLARSKKRQRSLARALLKFSSPTRPFHNPIVNL
jgi:hypothetical protein